MIGGRPGASPVTNGSALARASGVERVLIHDAARPFPLPRRHRAAAHPRSLSGSPALPAVDTTIRAMARRSRATNIARPDPQAFRLRRSAAPALWTGGEASDDAQIARAAGLSVAIVAGDPALDKLTYEADFRRVEATLLSPRTGFGFDVHALAAGEALWLGGVRVPHDKGLKGHSDADVVLHALTDAILGAIAAGDIGVHFPPSDPRWRKAPSSLFLEHARDLVETAGGRIAHVDVTIICEAPRIGPYRDAMRARIATLLRLSCSRTSIKATTTEQLGFTGRGEGIAAQAVATIMMGDDRC